MLEQHLREKVNLCGNADFGARGLEGAMVTRVVVRTEAVLRAKIG